MTQPAAPAVTPLVGLSAEWRQAANEATVSDVMATYLKCAAALDAALLAFGLKTLMAICEGCGHEVLMPTKRTRNVYPDLPPGWSQCGTSKHGIAGHGTRLAAWCPTCREKRI